MRNRKFPCCGLIRGTCRGATELWNKQMEFPYLTSLFFKNIFNFFSETFHKKKKTQQ